MKKRKKSVKKTEIQLLPRLEFMGYLLLILSIGFFLYALNTGSDRASPEGQLLPEEELASFPDPAPEDTFNFFAVSALFGTIGTACILTAVKRKSARSGTK